MFHVVLHEPEIPANTGNIIRLCANSGCRLHLVEPLGFRLDRRSVRRAALDYDELAVLTTHASFTACQEAMRAPCWYAIETGGARSYEEARFHPGDVLLFGAETRGLPPEVLGSVPEAQRLRVPMRPGNRSLNLSNCVAIVVYEAWRQNGFALAGAARRTDAPDANRTPA